MILSTTSKPLWENFDFVICDNCLSEIDIEAKFMNVTKFMSVVNRKSSGYKLVIHLCKECEQKINEINFTCVHKMKWFAIAYKYKEKEYEVIGFGIWS